MSGAEPGRARRLLATRRGVVVLLLAAGGLLVLSVGRTWVSGTAEGVASTAVSVSGREAAPAAVAAAFVVLAAAAAMTTAGRLVLRLAAGVVVLGGLAVAAASAGAVADPAAALRPAAATATGVRDAALSEVSVGPWPWVATAAGVVVVAAGVLALVAAGRWTAPRRFDVAAPATPADAPAGERERSMDAWDALSRGEDPT